MQTRTRLTTPPGEEPAPPPSIGSSVDPAQGDRYVPGLALPTEPSPPSRYRKAIIIALIIGVLALVGYVALQVVTAGEDFDPAVGENPGESTTEQPTDG